MLGDQKNKDPILQQLQRMDSKQLMPQDLIPAHSKDKLGEVSRRSSLGQSWSDDQQSIAISSAFVDLEKDSNLLLASSSQQLPMREERVSFVKEAIIDLYLAIKIRSTEELNQIDDNDLKEEKEKLKDSADCFQILEYIRSSIEIIMNLKIEDLDKKEDRNGGKKDEGSPTSSRGAETSISGISIESRNLIQQSMKDALLHMIESSESKKDKANKYRWTQGPPAVYEKIMQKLEADIRGHIRLEHEMKIHMDYLEGRVEKFEKDKQEEKDNIKQAQVQIDNLQAKLDLLQSDRNDKDSQLSQMKQANEALKKKLKELEVKNGQMSLKIEQGFSSAKAIRPIRPLTVACELGSHELMGSKPTFNSIDIGYAEPIFEGKTSKTNTHLTHLRSKSKISADAPFCSSIHSANTKSVYQTITREANTKCFQTVGRSSQKSQAKQNRSSSKGSEVCKNSRFLRGTSNGDGSVENSSEVRKTINQSKLISQGQEPGISKPNSLNSYALFKPALRGGANENHLSQQVLNPHNISQTNLVKLTRTEQSMTTLREAETVPQEQQSSISILNSSKISQKNLLSQQPQQAKLPANGHGYNPYLLDFNSKESLPSSQQQHQSLSLPQTFATRHQNSHSVTSLPPESYSVIQEKQEPSSSGTYAHQAPSLKQNGLMTKKKSESMDFNSRASNNRILQAKQLNGQQTEKGVASHTRGIEGKRAMMKSQINFTNGGEFPVQYHLNQPSQKVLKGSSKLHPKMKRSLRNEQNVSCSGVPHSMVIMDNFLGGAGTDPSHDDIITASTATNTRGHPRRQGRQGASSNGSVDLLQRNLVNYAIQAASQQRLRGQSKSTTGHSSNKSHLRHPKKQKKSLQQIEQASNSISSQKITVGLARENQTLSASIQNLKQPQGRTSLKISGFNRKESRTGAGSGIGQLKAGGSLMMAGDAPIMFGQSRPGGTVQNSKEISAGNPQI